ncbi:MAG TPA: hypothetical protein VEY88_02530 [Archangium sp.]|nr:hypothetical protein [Archangium sp.]
MSMLGKMRPVLYAALPVVLVYALWRMPLPPWPGFYAGCMDSFPLLTAATGWSALVGSIVLGACLARLGTGRSIPLVPILVAGCAPWFATIGFGLGLWSLMPEQFGPHLSSKELAEALLVLSAELQFHRLTGVIFTACLLFVAVLVLGVEALLESRRSSPERSTPGRWLPKTALVLAASALCLCLLAVLDAWVAIEPLGLLSEGDPKPDFLLIEQSTSGWVVAHGLYTVGTGGLLLGAVALVVRSLMEARARRPVALWPTLLALCAGATLLLDAQLFRQTFPGAAALPYRTARDSARMAEWMSIPGSAVAFREVPTLFATPEGLRHPGGTLAWEEGNVHLAVVLAEEAERLARSKSHEVTPSAVTVAMHAGLETNHLRRLFEGARHSGLQKLVLVGRPAYSLSESTRRALRFIHPVLGNVVSPHAPAVSLFLRSDSHSASYEPWGRLEAWWTADIGPAHRVTLTRFPSGVVEVLDLRHDSRRLDEAGPRFLRVSEGADVADVIELLRRGNHLRLSD